MQQEKIKTCPTCGAENDLYAPSCKQCGRRLRELVLEKICPLCFYSNNIDSRRCEECGRSLVEVSVRQPERAYSEIQTLKAQLLSESRAVIPALSDDPSIPENSFEKIYLAKRRINRKRFLIILTLLMLFVVTTASLISFDLRLSRSTNNLTPISFSTVPLLPDGVGEVITTDGQNIGVNDGAFEPFDVGRAPEGMALKQQAAQQLHTKNLSSAISLWQTALGIESNDAESLIYIENQRVLSSGKPYVTLVAGTAFTSPFPDTQYESELQGIYVAQHEFNGGNNAFLLRVLIANSGSNVNENNTALVAGQIAQIARKDLTVVGVIGWLSSSNTANALSLLTKARIPVISPQASSDYLTGISPYFFRVVPPNKVQTAAATQFMKNTLHVKNPVVFVDPKDLYSQNLAQDFEDQFAGKRLPEVTFTTDSTRNFLPLLQNALKYHPDAFYFTSASSADAGFFQDALPTTGPYANVPAVGGGGGFVIHKNGYNRWYFTASAYHDESNTSIAKKFVQEYSADFNPYKQEFSGIYSYTLADDNVILSYDATSVVLTALQMAYMNKKATPISQDLANSLPQITGVHAFQGVSGQIAFGSDHDPVNKAIVILHASPQGYTQIGSIQGCFLKGCG